MSETHGREEGYGFVQTLLATVPTIRGVVDSWAFRDDRLFIEMRFLVERDGATVEVRNVDVFTFADGVAVRRVAHLDPAALLGG